MGIFTEVSWGQRVILPITKPAVLTLPLAHLCLTSGQQRLPFCLPGLRLLLSPLIALPVPGAAAAAAAAPAPLLPCPLGPGHLAI